MTGDDLSLPLDLMHRYKICLHESFPWFVVAPKPRPKARRGLGNLIEKGE
jgi:hypothetical protein